MNERYTKLSLIRWHINYVKRLPAWREKHASRMEQVESERFNWNYFLESRCLRRWFFLLKLFSSTQLCAPLRESFQNTSLFSFHFRAIPQAGYIRIGALRYGIRVSSLDLSDYPQSNKSQTLSPTNSSLIMSPSSETISAKAICDDGCCCCIGSTVTSKTRLPVFQSGENYSTKFKLHSQIENLNKNRRTSLWGANEVFVYISSGNWISTAPVYNKKHNIINISKEKI